MDSKEVVVIHCHGNPSAIGTSGDAVNVTISTVQYRLKKKEVSLLIILSCNCGHYDYRNDNIALAFWKKVTGCVIAADGTEEPTVSATNPAFESKGDMSWATYTKNKRGGWAITYLGQNKGWLLYGKTIIYRDSTKTIYSSTQTAPSIRALAGKKKLTVTEMLSYWAGLS